MSEMVPAEAIHCDLDEMSSDYVPPPEGWFDFGTHVDIPGPLEFSSEVDESGVPRWERLYPPE